jgi:protein-S-isoprenylcysteine O-methyltransferase Ste14
VVWIALTLDVVFLVAAFGVRTALQWRRTGDTGWRVGRPRSGGELGARVLLVGSAVLLGVSLAAPGEDPGLEVSATGVVVCAGTIALVLVAQLQMGSSWRIGVDADERTTLVTEGLYRWMRNPIYTGMVGFAAGQVLLLPSAWSVAAAVAMTLGVELQVRVVEEPYLRRTHGESYSAWAARAGRFIPLVGRDRAVLRS